MFCCSYDVSRLLRKIGFNEKTFYVYIKGQPNSLQHNIRGNIFSNSEMENTYSSPTHEMAMWWLRKEHHIHIIPEISDPSEIEPKYYCMIWNTLTKQSYIIDIFNSYEDAVENALLYTLNNLIKN